MNEKYDNRDIVSRFIPAQELVTQDNLDSIAAWSPTS